MPKKSKPTEREKTDALWYVEKPDDFPAAVVDFTLEGEGGRLSCQYDSRKVLVGIFNTFGRLFLIPVKEVEALAEERGISFEEMHRELREDTRRKVFALFEYARDQLYEQLQPKLEEALRELGNQLIVQAIFDLGMNDPALSKADALNALDNRFRKQRNRRMGIARGGSEASFDLSQLSTHYARLLSAWKKAKRTFRRNSESRTWPAIVKADVGDLPADLIARLADPPNLPDRLLAKLEKHGGGSSPSDIALEHAARECGATPYAYTLRHLRARLAEQREFSEVQSSVLDFTKKRPF